VSQDELSVHVFYMTSPSLWLCLALFTGPWSLVAAQQPQFINPSGLTRPTGYSHVVVTADRRTAYIAGQVAFDSSGAVVGPGDFKAQAEKVFANLRVALASIGATFGDVVKTTTFITDLEDLPTLREVRGRYLDAAHPPANSLIPVKALARPELLLEIEAVVDLSGKQK
jgi:enamine deaminase RidA (YjgF/YER057c/UK114 family)